MSDFTATYRVHVYEVDAFNELTTPGLLRFLQQTASDASAAIGFDLDWYDRAGTVWLIRRTSVERTEVVRYDDELRVRTWVSDVRRVRSERSYEVTRSRDGALVARGCTDWVYCDSTRGTPARIPDALQKALMPDGVQSQLRRPPTWPPPPPSAFRARRRIELADLDSVAHVNNARYAAFLEQDLYDALAHYSWPLDPTVPSARLRLRTLDLEYLEAALYGEAIEGVVWATSLDDHLTCAHALERDRRALVRAQTTWGWNEGVFPEAVRNAAQRMNPAK